MKKKIISLFTASVMIISAMSVSSIISNAENENNHIKVVENLDRGLVAVKTDGGVYLSWRLFGTEDLASQAFDIYRDGDKIYTTGTHDATCYTDTKGTNSSKYIVVPTGESITGESAVTPWTTNSAYNGNSVAYKDILFTAPEGGTIINQWQYDSSTKQYYQDGTNENYTYSANDMSTGDLDGDGEYEIIVKWDPSNSKDNSQTGFTGNVYIDAYKLDGTRLWRMDLGKNIRAGAHYTQFLVYDFDSDGKSEVIYKTAPGSKDGKGNFVSQAGKTDEIKNADNTASYVTDGGQVLSGSEWLTVFNGETGAAMDTVNYDPPRSINNNSEWGDGYGNRCERYLAGVAYLDGVHPSAIMVRGYYTYAYAAAYSWDGTNLEEQWLSSNAPIKGSDGGCTVKYADGTTTKHQADKTLYGQGAHSVSVADVDNDGFDELIFGSAVLDNDGTVLVYDGRGHGDAEHVSDFDNDGRQEIFMVHEAGKDNSNTIDFAVDIKRYGGDVICQAAKGDIGRGVMANIDDAYAASSGNLAAFWSSASSVNLYNQKGEIIGSAPNSNNKLFQNFLIYWDGDLGRELLDQNLMAKQSIINNSTTRFNYNKSTNYLPGVSSNNGSKATPGLVADILGDWREEAVYPLSNGTGMRIFFSTIPTDYRLTTLMHDSQYRCAVAWQNVGYNQPPHTSYYIGSAALAKSGGTTLNYLAPATSFDDITYPNAPDRTPKPIVTPAPTPKRVTTTLYERGFETAWSDADKTEWNATELTDDYGLHQQGGNGSNSAKITINPEKDKILNIEAYWIGMSNTGRKFENGNCSYFRFGDIWIMQNDQSNQSAYSLSEFSSTNYTVFNGPNTYRNYDISTKNWYVINIEIDTKTNMLNSLTVRSSSDLNTDLLKITNQTLENPDYSTIEIGYKKTGSVTTTNNEYLKAVKVTQSEEIPVPTSPVSTPAAEKTPIPTDKVTTTPVAEKTPTPEITPTASPVVASYPFVIDTELNNKQLTAAKRKVDETSDEDGDLYAAMYDGNGLLVGLVIVNDTPIDVSNADKVMLFMWSKDENNKMKPIAEAVKLTV